MLYHHQYHTHSKMSLNLIKQSSFPLRASAVAGNYDRPKCSNHPASLYSLTQTSQKVLAAWPVSVQAYQPPILYRQTSIQVCTGRPASIHVCTWRPAYKFVQTDQPLILNRQTSLQVCTGRPASKSAV
jgi:hypothetical protein